MNRNSAIALLALSLLVIAVGAQAAPKKAGAPVQISATGTVEAGVEAGCLVLTDAKTKALYNLFFSGPKPAVGTAIQFTGTPHGGATACMQGRAVDVKKWSPATSKKQ